MRQFLLAITLAFMPSWAGAVEISDYINKQRCDQIIDHHYYQVCYSYWAKGAVYVGYWLDGSKVSTPNDIKKRPRFYPDPAVPAAYRTTPSDYTRNEWHADRGHLAPDADFDWSRQSLHAVYAMSNIVPQYYVLNRKIWSKAERYERYVARKLGRVLVINGVVYDSRRNPRMQKSGIAYPVAFWKRITNNQGFDRCFWFSNLPQDVRRQDRSLRAHTVACSAIH